MAKHLLIDGFNMAFRAYYAVAGLSRSDGFPTNALYGWIGSMWKLLDDQNPDEVVVFFDLGGAQDKLELLPEYKANRGETPEDFEKQVPVIKKITQAMGFSLVEKDGVESDDLLAAYAFQLYRENNSDSILIVSADKDFAQCVNDRIHMLLPPPTANPRLGWRNLDPEGVEKKYGVPPSMMADYLSLIGDTSDNIPGVPGCGPKTASKWLLEYKTIEGILQNASELKPVRFQNIVPDMAEQLEINQKIIALHLADPPESVAAGELNVSALLSVLEEMEMKTHLKEAQKRYAQGELAL